MAKTKIVVGVNKEIEDLDTDVVTTFHVIQYLGADVKNGYLNVTVESYARQKTFERGGRSVAQVQFNLTGKPPRGVDLLDWVYQAIVASVEGMTDANGQPLVANKLTDGELVYGDLPTQ